MCRFGLLILSFTKGHRGWVFVGEFSGVRGFRFWRMLGSGRRRCPAVWGRGGESQPGPMFRALQSQLHMSWAAAKPVRVTVRVAGSQPAAFLVPLILYSPGPVLLLPLLLFSILFWLTFFKNHFFLVFVRLWDRVKLDV